MYLYVEGLFYMEGTGQVPTCVPGNHCCNNYCPYECVPEILGKYLIVLRARHNVCTKRLRAENSGFDRVPDLFIVFIRPRNHFANTCSACYSFFFPPIHIGSWLSSKNPPLNTSAVSSLNLCQCTADEDSADKCIERNLDFARVRVYTVYFSSEIRNIENRVENRKLPRFGRVKNSLH